MVSTTTLTTLLLNILASVLLVWATWRTYQSREQPNAEAFLLLVTTLALWAVFSLAATVMEVAAISFFEIFFELVSVGAMLFLPVAWIIYALSYTGRKTVVTRNRILLLSGILLPIVITATALAIDPSEAVIERVIVFAFGWVLLYGVPVFLGALYATYLLIGLSWGHPRVSNKQIVVLTVGVAAPYLLFAGDNSIPLVSGTTVGLFFSGGFLVGAIRQYPVLTGFPKADYVARTRVVETLQEALVVLDWHDHVLDVNERAIELFGGSPDQIIGEPVQSFIDGVDEVEFPTGATGSATLRTSKGLRHFQFSVSAVNQATTDGEDDPVARTVVFRDITDQETREQRLTVLNRILRHNVRNDLDVVLAYADQVANQELRTGIRESTIDLLELSKKVREAETVMTESTDQPESVDLSDLAHTVVEKFRSENASADISLVCPNEVLISSQRAPLRQILFELLENSLQHTTKDSPCVEVTIRELADDTVEISIADDGPGLPDREQDILASGIETQLKHSQGIGLWLVTWAVTQLGGDLQFRENEPEGSIVTVRLHNSLISTST